MRRETSQAEPNSLSRCNNAQPVGNECPTGKFQFWRPAEEKLHYKIDVIIDATFCPGDNTFACMEYPLQITQQTPTGEKRRMRLGRTMGIRQDKIQSYTAENLGTIVHELLHSFGIGHMTYEPSELKLYVPGTAKPSDNPFSIMWSPRTDYRRKHTLQADDIDMMRTLFPPSVPYFAGFSTVNAN